MRLVLLLASTLALAACDARNEPDTAVTGDGASTAEAGNASETAMASSQPGAPAATPQAFVAQAAASDLFEIESSKLAQTNAKSQAVKDFAAMMVADHTKSTAELKDLAGRANPAITVAPMLSPKQQADLDALKQAKGDFDTQYAQKQVAAHEATLSLLESYAAAGTDGPLKEFARKTAPVVSKHLGEARQLGR